MKKLNTYIIERQLINNLPFSKKLFVDFITTAIEDGDYDDSPYWESMKKRVENFVHMHHLKFGQNFNIWSTFVGWCEAYNELHYKHHISAEEFYDMMKTIPLDRINNVLGAGSEGVVLALNDKKVFKMFYADEIPSDSGANDFINWCAKHDSKVFPKVYKIGKNWCIMERLKTNTLAVKDLASRYEFKYKIEGKPLEYYVKNEPSKLPNFTVEDRKAYEWGLQCKHEMKSMNSKYIAFGMDLSLKNLGERDNGNIIWFDI